MSFPKVCACGCIYTVASWVALPFAGEMLADDPDEAIVLRHCGCMSTIAVRSADDPSTAPTLRPEAVDAWFAEAGRLLEAP